MTGSAFTAPAARPDRDDLAARVFRALGAGSGPHALGSTHIVVPAGTPCPSGPSPGAIARPVSVVPVPGLEPARRGQSRDLQSGPVL
jgi:hypothetical protein